MNEYIKIAWRSIWRNKRRTLITTASILFAVFFALVMRSFQIGSYDHMVNNAIQAFRGHIQIHKQGFWKDQEINNTFELNPELLTKIDEIENVEKVVPRLESFALASSGEQTKGVIICAVDPEIENELTKLRNKMVKGEYFSKNSNGIMVSERLSRFLGLNVGDSLVLMSQGYHGVSAAGLYPIEGIVSFRSPVLDNKLIYMPLPLAQEFFSTPNMLSSLALNLKDHTKLEKAVSDISEIVDEEIYEIMDWKQMEPELDQQIESDNISGLIMLGILYLIIAFGVFGTVLMMTAERKREFGVMISIGMQKTKLAGIIIIEMIMLGFIGVFSGLILSLPVIQYGLRNPIKLEDEMADMMLQFGVDPVMPLAWQPEFLINQSLIVLTIVLVSILYPVSTILKLNVIKALRH